MPTTKPRITITLDPRSHEVLTRLSAASGDSMSQIVASFVDLALPSLERVVAVLERAKTAPAEARAGLAAAIERAERNLMPLMQEALGQQDMFLADIGAAVPDADAQRPQLERPRRKASGHPLPPAKVQAYADTNGVPPRGSTPVPVTRGSGGPRKARKGVQGGTV